MNFIPLPRITAGALTARHPNPSHALPMNSRFLLRSDLLPALLAASLGLAQATDPVISNLTAAQETGMKLVKSFATSGT